ncbi:MAG: transglutaminase family protein [Chitinophagaceae bacterium]
MPRFKIHHVTKYTYEQPVKDSANQIILFPIKDEYQEVMKHQLSITGEPSVDIYKDYYGNEVGSFTSSESHKELVIDSKMEVITKLRQLPDDARAREEQWNQLLQVRNQVNFIDFLKVEQFDALNEVTELLEHAQNHEVTPMVAAERLNEYVFNTFLYIKGITSVETTITEIWKLKAGVCQDFAHILSAMLRIIKIPARYVSGYVCPNKNGMRGEGATHAWVEAFIPFYGWVGLDPTNNVVVNDLHVRLAVGRSFPDCSPVKGTYKGTSQQTLEVGVTVSYEDGHINEDFSTELTPQPNLKETQNSYRRFMEMQQQQQ